MNVRIGLPVGLAISTGIVTRAVDAGVGVAFGDEPGHAADPCFSRHSRSDRDIAAGHSRHRAIIDATVRRARPVLLTALAAILGMISLAGSLFWGPMAITIMGGLFVATVLTLLGGRPRAVRGVAPSMNSFPKVGDGARDTSASLVYADLSWALSIGSFRTRLPVAAKIALVTAGITADVPGSPTPPGASVFLTRWTSIEGASLMRSIW